MNDNLQSTSVSGMGQEALFKRFDFDVDAPQVLTTMPLSAVALAGIRAAHFDAYWSAPRAARDIHILAAIQQGWASLEAEQFTGVPFTLPAFARSQAAQP